MASMIESSSSNLLMVWECTLMANYDSVAREARQKFIKDIKPKLEAIHLISNNLLIRVGASTIGMIASVKIHTWEDMEQFHAGF